MRQNKPDIPQCFKPSKDRPVYSSVHGFSDGMTLVSYVPKKNKAVVLLSTMHQTAETRNDEKRKPEIILYYNKTKGGVDMMDMCVRTYTTKRQTRRWPMVLWNNAMDVAAFNAYIVFNKINPKYFGQVSHTRRLFLVELAKELMLPYMQKRSTIPSLTKQITSAMELFGIRNETNYQTAPVLTKKALKRKRCNICPTSKDRKCSTVCSKCNNFVCTDHYILVCQKCMT